MTPRAVRALELPLTTRYHVGDDQFRRVHRLVSAIMHEVDRPDGCALAPGEVEDALAGLLARVTGEPAAAVATPRGAGSEELERTPRPAAESLPRPAGRTPTPAPAAPRRTPTPQSAPVAAQAPPVDQPTPAAGMPGLAAPLGGEAARETPTPRPDAVMVSPLSAGAVSAARPAPGERAALGAMVREDTPRGFPVTPAIDTGPSASWPTGAVAAAPSASFTVVSSSGTLVDIAAVLGLAIQAGYHEATNNGAGMRMEDYLALWQYAPIIRPNGCGADYALPLLVDLDVPAEELLRRAQVYALVDLASCRDVVPAALVEGRRLRRYVAFTQDGTRSTMQAVQQCLQSMGPSEQGLTLVEGLHFVVQYGDVLRRRAVNLVGSRVSPTEVPTVASIDSAQPLLLATPFDHRSETYGSASRWRDVVGIG